jgi:hypothetical protein
MGVVVQKVVDSPLSSGSRIALAHAVEVAPILALASAPIPMLMRLTTVVVVLGLLWLRLLTI